MRDVAREAPLDAPRGAAHAALALPPDLSTPSKQLMALERVAALRQAIDRLSDDHRRVIILRNVEHRSFEAIGHVMQRSPQAACKLWSRAVSALRQELLAVDISR
jgi:RNA polymerase sigma-70 factor (ECF subfamily)